MVNDRAGHARHEGPVLPSRDVNRTQLRASPPDHEHLLTTGLGTRNMRVRYCPHGR